MVAKRRVLIDDVFFQINGGTGGIARLWSECLSSDHLKHLANDRRIEFIVLNRSGLDVSNGTFSDLSFPTFHNGYSAIDSIALDSLCIDEGIDLFVSTYFTFPSLTPTFMWCYDLIPEFLADPSLEQDVGWQHRTLALLKCEYFASISKSTRDDLFRFYPKAASASNSAVAYPWLAKIFRDGSTQRAHARRRTQKPFVLMVGDRTQLNGYKNGRRLFEAADEGALREIDIVCVGGDSLTDDERHAGIEFGVEVRRVVADDLSLHQLYADATALVTLSRYEGFGIPVIESLACGTPVICLANSSLPEAGGSLATYLQSDSPSAIRQALEFVSSKTHRERVKQLGPLHARSFRMESSIEVLIAKIDNALANSVKYGSSRRARWWRERMELLAETEI